MKSTKDENGVITFHYNFFDQILMKISSKWFRFTRWFYHTRFGDWYRENILWRIFNQPYYRPNSWEEASINLNNQLFHRAIKKGLIEMKERFGEEEVYKILKKKLTRKHYKETMEDIKRWKSKGDW
jgi:hypothetical protein